MNTSYNYADFIGLNLGSSHEQDSRDYEITTTRQAETETETMVQMSLLKRDPKPVNINN
jgi:hypothetical protein